MDTKKAAKIFKALSNPNRLELYFKIAEMHESSFQTNCECFVTDIFKRNYYSKRLNNCWLV
jgi:DNA-binding transcriptional ArsR family regulator